MGCCARVIVEWSTDPKFSREMRKKSYTGLSLARLVRSVAPATMVRVRKFDPSALLLENVDC